MTPQRAIVVGASAGGPEALLQLLAALPAPFPLPILIVQHVHENSPGTWPEILSEALGRQVKNAEDKEPIAAGVTYIAPPGYHLLVERDRSLSLCVDERVRFARPSVDVLFQSAADAFRGQLLAVVLTGANADGACGAAAVRARGGSVIVQTPSTAHVSTMPQAALDAVPDADSLPLTSISAALEAFSKGAPA